LKKKFKKNLT